MKHGRKPTVEQRKLITNHGLNWSEWLVFKDQYQSLSIVHRDTGEKRVLSKAVFWPT